MPVSLPLAYLLGAIPFAYLTGRLAFGFDIRAVGSGNVGATNLARALLATGKARGARRYLWAVLVFALDVLKGYAAVEIPRLLRPAIDFPPGAPVPNLLSWQVACGAAAVVGHIFTVFLRFRGGKGVATSCGVGVGLAPLPTVLAAVSWGLILILTRYISIASVVALFLFPVYYGLWADDPLGRGGIVLGTSTILALVVLARHRSNLARIAGGTEPRWREEKPDKPAGG